MKGHSGIPPRVGTAPMSKTANVTGADFRSGLPARQPPAAAPGLPRAPPAGVAGGSLPAKPPAAAAAGKSPQPEPSAAAATTTDKSKEGRSSASSVAASETAAEEKAAGEAAEDIFPEDGMYEIAQFISFKQSQVPVPPVVVEYASKLWKEMPEHLSSVQNTSLRESLFKEVNATMPSKVLVERKLHNEVLGILGKVTENNIERMKKDLTDLPIRQSTEEEIGEVINTIFRKCTRPEDSRYTPLYVQLIHHLINTIGDHEPAGVMIRSQIMIQCRNTFLGATDASRELEDRIAELPEEEAQLERMQFTGKQKANIYFLGLLFRARIASEMVVVSVLENLLYGDGKRRRVVPEYSVVHFMELLQTCGPYLSDERYLDLLPRFVKTLSFLFNTHPSIRLQFLIQNFFETMKNNWVPVHGRDAQPAGSANGTNNNHVAALNQRPAAVQIAFSSSIPDPTKRIPDREEFWKVMDDFFIASTVDEVVALVKHIPEEVLVVYASHWIGRYVTTYKYTQERARLGELFEQLDSKGAIPATMARNALMQHVQQAIDEDLFTDQPKYFAHWAAIIKGGRAIFPPSLHTVLLDMLVASHVSQSVLTTAITAISKVIDEANKPEQKDYQPQERFRVLQALLRYHAPFLASANCDTGEGEDEDEDEDEEDIVDSIGNPEQSVDVETTFFKVLCTCCDEGTVQPALQYAAEALKKSHNAAYPLISAFFTFVRYDMENLCSSYREVLKKITSVRPLVSLLDEVYVQWTKLECPESHYVGFVKSVTAVVQPKTDPVEKLKERLRAEYQCEKMVFLLEKAFK